MWSSPVTDTTGWAGWAGWLSLVVVPVVAMANANTAGRRHPAPERV